MADRDLSQLETAIKRLPGVLGCVVLANPDGTPAEVQAFTGADADRESVERAIRVEAARHGLDTGIGQTFVFELDAESHLGDSESLHRAAELAEQDARAKGPRGVLHALGTLHSLAESAPEPHTPPDRPPLVRVVLTSSSRTSDARVTLGARDAEITGVASGDKSSQGLHVVAEAAVDAAAQLVGGPRFVVRDVELVTACGREAVLVLVEAGDASEMLGSALVRAGPLAEAAVRATLDAINRRLARAR